jgi:hypothetical protein
MNRRPAAANISRDRQTYVRVSPGLLNEALSGLPSESVL